MIRADAVATFCSGACLFLRTYFPLFILYVAWYYHLVDGCWNSKTNLFLGIAWVTFTYYLSNGSAQTDNSTAGNHHQRRHQRQQQRLQNYFNRGGKAAISKGTGTSGHSPDEGRLEMRLRCRFNSTGLNVLTENGNGLPDNIFIHICGFLHPRDVTAVACLDRYSRRVVDGYDYDSNAGHDHHNESSSNILWKALWYRDYASVILDWDIGRQALQRSINAAATTTPENIHQALHQAFDQLLNNSSRTTAGNNCSGSASAIKQFYFQFGESYVNYLLAGQNTKESCLLGIHGHIFDFTEFAQYHPGLIEPIRKECGADVTYFFEDIPHSKAARKIARKLCVVANRSTLNSKKQPNPQQRRASSNTDSNTNIIGEDIHGNGYGLYRIPVEALQQHRNWFISETNTRPPPEETSKEKIYGIDRILPLRTTVKEIKANTIQSIRTRFLEQQRIASGKTVFYYNIDYNHNDNDKVHIYYDPFQLQWRGWYNNNSTGKIDYFDIQM